MEHYKHPRNKGLSNAPEVKKYRIKNPSCGDDITVETMIQNGKITE
ncbi:MAG: iron-sulfur cluster assembly scaffold protein, partial [Bacilli bacterium]|nr:iron-sulfur cluster assembly scaffold protein [Bacilli bacterium]